MSEKVSSLYICPWSLQDSLCQSQSLAYLKGLTAHRYKFGLITFENPRHQFDSETEKLVKADLAAHGIFWYPVRYRSGTSIFNKIYENSSGIAAGIAAFVKHRPQIIHSRTSLPLGVALTLSKLFRLKFLYDADSILSEEYAETGHWTRESVSYKLMSRLEAAARRRADKIIVLAKPLQEDLQRQYSVKVSIEVIPCCSDTEKFCFNSKTRNDRRRELGLTNEKVLVYVGKVGARYLVEETFAFFNRFNQQFPASRLLIISQENEEIFRKIAHNQNVPEKKYFIKKVAHNQVQDYLSASDVGLCLIRQMKCERGSSPIKFSEYLAAGLPVVITDKIGDCSNLVKSENIGVTLKQTDEESYDRASRDLIELLKVEKDKITLRCRRVAEKKFSLNAVGIESYKKIYEELLSDAR